MILSRIRFSSVFPLFVGFLVSPAQVIMGIMYAFAMVCIASICMFWTVCSLLWIGWFGTLLPLCLWVSCLFIFCIFLLYCGLVLSWPRLYIVWAHMLPCLSCLIDCLIYLVVIWFGSGGFSIVLSVSITACCMCSVQCSYSGFPGRAWYRSQKYSLMWIFVSSRFSSLVPSSVIVSYSSFWRLLSILLLCF